MSCEFASLSHRAQLSHTRSLALEALRGLEVEPVRLSLANHGFNTTYKVQTVSSVLALRLNVNSRRTPEQIRGEVAWVQHLSDTGSVWVPRPFVPRSGEGLARVFSKVIGREICAVAYEWLPGRHASQRPGKNLARLMGETMRGLHDSTKSFRFPLGASRPLLESVLEGISWRLPEDHVFIQSLEIAEKALKSASKHSPPIPIHFDLHFWNVLLHQGRMSALDFDDSVIGWPIVDAAQSLFYTRRRDPSRALERSFWRALQLTPAQAGITEAEFEALLVGRALLLANDLLINMNQEMQAMAPKYVGATRLRLQHFLDTGLYDAFVGIEEMK